jgi:hypothetical protein
MKREEALNALIEIQNRPPVPVRLSKMPDKDFEQEHIDADEVLCQLLESLGYEDVVSEYRKIEKFHS